MGTIPIGTSSPPNVCDGLPLLPAVGQLRAGIASTASSNTILDVSATIVFSRLKVSAYYQFLFGLCGPALAFLFQNVQYQLPEGSGTLALTFPNSSNVESGGFVGMEVGGGLNLNIQIWTPDHWYSPWKGHWSAALNLNVGFSIDFINLLADLVEYLLQEGAADGLFDKDSANSLGHKVGLASSYSVSGSTTAPLLPSNDLRVTSTITLPINLATYTPELAAAIKLLKTVKGSLGFGPAITFGFPSDLSLKNFTIEGGQGQGSSATYDITNISGDTVTAVGPPFTPGATVSRFGTTVTYTGGFNVALSLYFSLTACKIFNFSVSVPAVDLTRLLGLVPAGDLYTLDATVDSEVSGSCVLAPAMSISFVQGGNPTQTVNVYQPVTIQVTLGQSTSTAATVSLTITPAAPGFPNSLSIPVGGTSSNTVNYTFANTCVVTGDPSNPGATAPATPTAFTQTYQVTATLSPQPQNSCALFTTTASLNVNNSFLSVSRGNYQPAAPGPTPSWGTPNQGATINADSSQPPTDAAYLAVISLSAGAGINTPKSGQLTLTLLDEQRVPHTGSNVFVSVASLSGEWSSNLNPSATGQITMSSAVNSASINLLWRSSGPPQGYSNRFFLIIDGGCLFGQNEFWLDVWNWS